jgi:hypothetical protein
MGALLRGSGHGTRQTGTFAGFAKVESGFDGERRSFAAFRMTWFERSLELERGMS